MKKNLVLLGMMATGKTTLGKIVAKNHSLKFIDTDANIEKKNSMTIMEIFEKKGEKFFRKEEEKEVLQSLKIDNSVIALGGGAFINKNIRENILKSAISIWLETPIEILDKRIKKNFKRPLLTESRQKKLRDLHTSRKMIYALAHHRIKCHNLSKENIVKKIISIYEKY